MINVSTSGPHITVQDLGRRGHGTIGVGRSGAMDTLSLRTGNALLGNEPNAAAIEVSTTPFRVRFEAPGAIAITGADSHANLSGIEVPPMWAINVDAGMELNMSVPRTGMRSYVCVAGGIDVPLLLGSRSTDMKSRFGGMRGRALAVGDRLSTVSPCDVRFPDGGIGAVPFALPASKDGLSTVRVIPAAETGALDTASTEAFWNTEWTVTPQSNRMGLRLDGPNLRFSGVEELLSHPIVPGVIQVPRSGHPIIQAVEANTCGGYPKVGVIIGADLWKLGQLRPGGRIKFELASHEDAVAGTSLIEAYLERIAFFSRLCRSCI